MAFIIDTYSNVIKTYTKSNIKKYNMYECGICHKKFAPEDAIIIQYDIYNPSTILCITHMSCIMTIIREKFPDFWKRYILDLI
jgi:hypothetical protein